MNKIYVGIIGLGVGQRHLETFLANKKCFVKYVCDFDQKKIEGI